MEHPEKLLMPILELVTRDMRELSEPDRSIVERNAKLLVHACVEGIKRVTEETQNLALRGEIDRAEALTLAIGLLGNLLDGSLFMKESCEAVAGATKH